MRRKITTLALAVAAAVPLITACAPTRAYAQSKQSDTPFTWSGAVQAGRWVYVRNLNGSVRVEEGTGNKVEVRAEKQWRRGNPDDVKITVKQVGSGSGDVLICALWNDRSSCDEDGYHSHSDGWVHGDNDRNDVSVQFVIKLPAGVKVDASTVNGGVDVDGATSDVIARTVNGSVDARSTGGAVSARTTNGDIMASSPKLDGDHTEFSTVNGTITVSLPASVNAEVDMRTVNGRLSSDFPLTIEGSFNPRRLHATLGKGGATLRLSTVNGSIRLRKLS
jgi:hypothetical protein